MEKHFEYFVAAHERQSQFQHEAELDRQRREASQSEDRRSFKQMLGESLVQLGQKLADQPEKA